MYTTEFIGSFYCNILKDINYRTSKVTYEIQMFQMKKLKEQSGDKGGSWAAQSLVNENIDLR